MMASQFCVITDILAGRYMAGAAAVSQWCPIPGWVTQCNDGSDVRDDATRAPRVSHPVAHILARLGTNRSNPTCSSGSRAS